MRETLKYRALPSQHWVPRLNPYYELAERASTLSRKLGNSILPDKASLGLSLQRHLDLNKARNMEQHFINKGKLVDQAIKELQWPVKAFLRTDHGSNRRALLKSLNTPEFDDHLIAKLNELSSRS